MIPLYPKSWQRAAVVTTIAAILVVGLCAWPYTVDDAFIIARYAARLARGQDYTFNDGPPTDGVTGPLWLLPGFIASLVRIDAVWAAKCAGLACTAAACGAFVHRLAQRSRGTSYACAAAALFAVQPDLGGWGVAGLETGAATLALTGAWLALTARPELRWQQLGICLGVLPWLRPELLAVGILFAIAAGMRGGLRRAAPAYALFAIGVAALIAFRLAYFGSVTPLAYHAKQGSLPNGFDYGWRGALFPLGVFGSVLLARAAWFGRWDDRLAVLAFGVHAFAVILAGGDWMPGFRLFVPVLPIAIGAISVGLGRLHPVARGSRLRDSGEQWSRQRRSFSYARSGLALAALCVLALDLATRIPDWRAAGQSRETTGRELAALLKRSAHRVALVDIGFLGYASGLEVVDLGGITDPEIARSPGGHLAKAIGDALLARRAPDAIVLHGAQPPLVAADGRLLAIAGYPVERRVASTAWVRDRFHVAFERTYAPRYHYVVLLPR